MIGYALRRFFRIAPLFYILIIFTYFYNPAGFTFDWKSILANVLFIFNLFPGHSYQTSLVLAGWTIGVEVIFYILFPFVFKRVDNIYKAIVFCIFSIILAHVFLAIIPILVNDWKNYNMYSIISRLPIFTFGIIAYFILKHTEKIQEKKSIGTLLVTLSALLFYSISENKTPFFNNYYWIGVMFLFLVIGLSLHPISLFVNAKTAWLGKISYSTYLIHSPIVALLFPVYTEIQSYGFGRVLTFSSCLILTVGIVIPLAALTYRLIENPANNYGRKIAKKWAGTIDKNC